ncbi:MAG: hypothetical protein KKA81_03900 [Bacteroidetes bacterium]|nr:hypothetical protein [Bacteroidota bacterium]
MMKNLITTVIIAVILSSCNTGPSLKQGVDYRMSAAGDTIMMERDGNGVLLSEYTVRMGKKDGPAWVYYPEGEVKEESQYRGGQKNGISRWFYKDGTVYEVTPYKDGKMHGIMRKFNPDGTLLAEIPYQEGEPIPGTREFAKTGGILSDYPDIRFFLDTTKQADGMFTLKMLRTDKEKEIAFHYYQFENDDSVRVAIPVRRHNGIGYMIFNTYNKKDIPDEVTVYGTFTSKRGVPVVLKKTWRKSDPVPVDPNAANRKVVRF